MMRGSHSDAASNSEEEDKRKRMSLNPAKKHSTESKMKEDLRRKAHQNSRRHKAVEKQSTDSLETRLADMKRTISAPTSPSSPINAAKRGYNSSSHSTPK